MTTRFGRVGLQTSTDFQNQVYRMSCGGVAVLLAVERRYYRPKFGRYLGHQGYVG